MLQTTPLLTVLALLALTTAAPARQGIAPPDNGPATVAWDAASGRLTLEYHGGAILSATVTANDAAGKPVWQGSLSGYCTWWSYRGDFTQQTLDAMLGMFAAKRLPDFGYDYMQFDDAYEQGNGSCPENFLNWDTKKFPGGSQYALKAIRDAGMKPGIWVHRVHVATDPHIADIVRDHPDWFVHKADGSFYRGRFFAIREARAYPWVLSTTRHLSQGGVCLLDEKWNHVSNILSGKSKVVAGDPYVLTIHLPAGFKLKAATVAGEKVEIANQQETATVRIVPTATKTIAWQMAFAQ